MSVNSHLKSSARSAQGWLKYATMFVMLLTLGIGNVWGATYFEDTFSNVGNQDNQSITSRTGWGSFTKCYSQGNSGLRIGSGSASGSIQKTTMSNIVGTKSIKVTIYVSKYNTQNATLTITAANGTISAISGVGTLSDGTITITPSANAGVTSTTAAATWTNDYKTEFTITGASSSTTITFSASRRLVLGPVKIEDAAASTFTVTVNSNNNSYGTVDKSSVTNVANNTSISASNNVLTVGSTTVTATPADADANYTYAFSSWSNIPASGKVTADVTVTANFTRTARTLTNYRTSCCDIEAATGLSASVLSGTSVRLTWTAPSPATGISKLQVVDGNGTVKVDNLSANATTADVTGLTECETYTFKIKSVGSGSCDTYSSTVDVQPFSGAKTITYKYHDDGTADGSFTTDCSHTSTTLPTPTWTGHTFNGWYTEATGGSKIGDGGVNYTPSTDIILHAQWSETDYIVTMQQSPSVGATLTGATNTAHYGGTINISATVPAGYQFVNWTSSPSVTFASATSASTSFTMPASNVTITANYVQVYTVTFVHHDKGVFSGGSTEVLVLSNANTITLPTVTSVSCGFYDTFEGWIASNSEYAESDDKPATVYAGSSSYTVQSDVTLRALYSYEDPSAAGYTKITSGVTAGTYLIATDEGSGDVAYTGKVTGQSYGGYADVTVSEGVISSKGDAVEVTITMSSSNFHMNDGTYYLGYSGSSNDMKFNTSVSDNRDLWKLDANGQIESVNVSGRKLEYNSGSPRFACYTGGQTDAFLFKKGGSKYCTNPSCVKPVGVHITYNANGGEMTCSNSNKTYKVVSGDNKYPQLASAYSFCTNATRTGYTLVGWNTRADGLGTTYDIDHSYSNLPVSGDLDGENWVTLNVYAMWASAVSFNLGNATGGTGVPAVVEEDGGFMLPEPTAAQIGTIPCGYSFYGWSENSVSSPQTKPVLFMPGTKYSGSERTLYAVYRLAGEGGSDQYYFTFEVDSKTYCITAKHGSYDRFVVEETTSGLEFGLDNGYLYYMENDAKVYVYWASSSTTVTTTSTMPNNNAYKTTFVPGANGTTVVTPATSGRYLQFTGTGMYGDYYDRAYYTTGGTNPTLVEATSYTYATNPSCETTATLQFVINGTGGTLNYPDGYNASSYEDLTPGTDVYLPTANYPGEWVFEGWMKGAPLPSQDHSPEGMSNFYKVTLNTTTYEATPAGTTTFYAVFSKTNNDKQFDPVNGGTYKIFGIKSDATKVYMPVWGGSTGTVVGVTDCASTGEYTITPGTGDNAGQYQITTGTYTLGVEGDGSGQTGLKKDANAWWDIEASTSTKGTWRMKIHGSSNRVLSLSSNTFGNYAVSQVDNPSQTTYRDMEIGECIYTEYTSTPENIPYITITGSPVKITSTNGERVYSPTKVHIEAHNFTGQRVIHLSATNGFGVDPSEVRTNASTGAYSGDVDVYYQPSSNGDGSITTSVLTASQVDGAAAEQVSQTFTAIKGRNMPANFVIAVKSGTQWYALMDTCRTAGTPKAAAIEVNNDAAPTAASLVPHNVEWSLKQVVGAQSSGSRPKDKVYFYEPNDDNKYALKANSAPNISTEAQVGNIGSASSAPYEWGLTTSDLCAYTIGNAEVAKNISINTAGKIGTHATNVVSDVLYLLPITAYYEPAEFQVVEWKANSVVVMYLGSATKASVQVGGNDEGGNQTLSDVKVDHGVFELAASGLTSAAFESLQIVFKNNGDTEIGRNYVAIPAIISGEVLTSAYESQKDLAESNDVVILKNGKLTTTGTGTDGTSYKFTNITVYGGGKLDIVSGTKLGVTGSLILRAGGVVAGAYDYVYPQMNLGGTLTNSSGKFYYEYVTDYTHWYHYVLPFDALTSTIKYPTEYYGSAVEANNTGSWVIKRYDGATRATGNYNAWVDIESSGEPTPTTVSAGHGYIFWGAPKKVTASGVKDRQAWGIQRIAMSKAAETAKTEEAGDKTVTGLGSYSGVSGNSGKNNDQGWNLIGNPYMVNLTGLNSTSIQVGQLVHTDTHPWDGKWEWDETDPAAGGLRYVTIPDDHFDTYTAQTMASFTAENPMKTGRTFFVQIAGANTSVLFASSNRASLMPALFARTEQSIDVETGIVLSDESKHDEVNFWIKDGKTEAYEYNADYPKTMNTTNFNIYGVHSNGELSWVAISPKIAEGSMAIGYQVPAAGDYMLSLSETYVSDEIEHVFVTDHGVSPEVTTDLMEEDYNFYVNQAETNDVRFTVAFKLKVEDPGTTTNVENTVGVDSDKPLKFIYNDKMYILRNGIIYDAVGKKVK